MCITTGPMGEYGYESTSLPVDGSMPMYDVYAPWSLEAGWM